MIIQSESENREAETLCMLCWESCQQGNLIKNMLHFCLGTQTWPRCIEVCCSLVQYIKHTNGGDCKEQL